MLSKYQAASQWLESAMIESQKTENVDLNKFLSDLNACFHIIQELVSLEANSTRMAALDQLSLTLCHHRNVLLAKKSQLETSSNDPDVADRLTVGSATGGSIVFRDKEDSHTKRRLSAIKDTIVRGSEVCFNGVAGLEQAKQALREAIILPMKYPHLFSGGRRPWRRVLLYGPPGTGKTRLAQAVSGEIESTFYCVSSSDLISSWVGESEKIIRDLFQHARKCHGKSVIFIDEIDSVCRVRSANEEEHTRRVKTELLKQMEVADTSTFDQSSSDSAHSGDVFLLCSTNCPWELDPAFLRRFQRRVYIPLPCRTARRQVLTLHLGPSPTQLSVSDWETLITQTEGYSGSDIATCVADALLEPVRELECASHWMKVKSTQDYGTGGNGPVTSPPSYVYVPCGESEPEAERLSINDLQTHQISLRPVCLQDFIKALARSHKTVSEDDLFKYEQFTIKYGQAG